jgi:hypothetical protein
MAQAAPFKNSEEREISRGGKSTAIWILALSLFFIAGGIAVAMLIRDNFVSPPARPGTTSATTTASETKPPSPGTDD